jgi:hypothetical protein
MHQLRTKNRAAVRAALATVALLTAAGALLALSSRHVDASHTPETTDSDLDGCADYLEIQRTLDPFDFWDIFDSPSVDTRTLEAPVAAGATPPFDMEVSAFSTDSGKLTIDGEVFSFAGGTSTTMLDTLHITGRALDGTVAADHAAGATVSRVYHTGSIVAIDIAGVASRYGATGSPAGDPLTLPPAIPAYHAGFDRTFQGPEIWRTGPPNGSITALDVVLASMQFGRNCPLP